jgi:hypothetical protein
VERYLVALNDRKTPIMVRRLKTQPTIERKSFVHIFLEKTGSG